MTAALRPLLLAMLLPCAQAQADFTTLWSLGVWDRDPTDEFGETVWGVNAAPGSATAKDHDFYFAGTYPAPIGTVAVSEPVGNLEANLADGNSPVRLHFTLTPAQAVSTARIRFTFHQIWGGWWDTTLPGGGGPGEGYGKHVIEVRWNGVLIKTETHTTPASLVLEANAGAVPLVAGENILSLHRAPFPASTQDGGVQFDALSLEIDPTALVDADTDGLPRWWEQAHQFSDTHAADAAQDTDEDGLTNAQEYARGTLPRVADSDQDGLKDGVETGTGTYISASQTGTQPLNPDSDGDSILDGAEVNGSPASNPLLVDTDGDGQGDAWELRTGHHPGSAGNGPPAFAGAIGINFVSELAPRNMLAAPEVAGLVPQVNWNNTWPLRTWNSQSGATKDVESPLPNVIVNSAGEATATTLTWATPATEGGGTWVTGNGVGGDGKLLDGYLVVNRDNPGVLTLGSIPFATYDVILYVGSSYDGARGYVRLNDNTATDRWFISNSTRPQTRMVEPLVSSATAPWRGNAIRYRNVTGSSVSLKIFRSAGHEVGFHAIQIVNSTLDSDGDGLPDAWEFTHKLNAGLNDAAADPDGDGLPNSGEYARQTDPRQTDTDGDGLTDLVETHTGTWVSTTNTGTHPLLADTDGDGLTDGFEAAVKPLPTNPHLADTDGDGRSDADELRRGGNPTVADAAAAFIPVVTTGPRTFDWDLPNVQIVWDHTRGHVDQGTWRSEDLFSISVANSLFPNQDALYLTLVMRGGRMTYFIHTNHNGAFSAPGDPQGDIYDSDWSNPPAVDLRGALGFSGHGKADISDRLRFRIQGTSSGAATNWNLTYTLTNQDTGQVVVTRAVNGCTLAASVHNGTALWQDRTDPPAPNRIQLWEHDGVQLFFDSTPLENTPAFAAWKDTDEDGLPDAWEDARGLNKNSAADAGLDGDNDSLTNLGEYLAGTLPGNPDTDGDLAKDGFEVQRGTNPLLASSKPSFHQGLPAGVSGEDLNGNGLPDAWEHWAGAPGLNAALDSDGDGMSNADEARAGTHPLDPTSRLWARSLVQGQNFTLRWPLLPNKQHQVWHSDTLAAWTPAAGSPASVGQEYRQTFPDALASGPRFFQARVQDLDSDGDGVSDWAEVNILGSDPASPGSTQGPVDMDADHNGTPETQIPGDYASLLELLLGADGSGGIAGGSPGAPSISRAQAARFLMQASFGPTVEDMDHVRELGYEGWISQQTALPPTLHSTYIKAIDADVVGQRTGLGGYNRSLEVDGPFLFGNNMMTAFARAAIQGEDQLRQRVAFALSQILVTSRRDANLENRCLGMADYYDIFVRHAFGSYEDILWEVTLHPVMGTYLSHAGNQKADPSINRYPDENYAREIMQLFTVGLWKLNPDGTRMLDGGGQPIPTYSNAEITQLARVMTGFWFSNHNWGTGGWTEQDYATPMTMHATFHDFGEKTLLDGHVIPARPQTQAAAYEDLRESIRHLMQHPNTPVFVSRQLIQFLVTDNPSPAYVQRVGAVFANDGTGRRGQLGAVVRAILLDPDARQAGASNSYSYGRLKEPVIRAMALGRAFGMKSVPDLLWWDWNDFFNTSRQEPTYSPSVFNFYRPDYRAPGLLTQEDKAGPVFQITDSYSAISFPNRLWQMMENGFSLWETYRFPLDLARESTLAAQPERLVDHLNLLFCAGRLRPATRALIINAVTQIPAAQTSARARVAAYLVMTAPEGAVMR